VPTPLRLVAAVLVAACCGVGGVSGDPSDTFGIDIRLRVDSSITPRYIRKDMKIETEAIWRPYGIRLDWSDVEAAAPAANGGALEVSVERERRPRMDRPAVLGRVIVKPGPGIWRPIRVSFDATEGVLERQTANRSTLPTIAVNREVGRALGRVLAHEIGHVLMGVSGHEPAGLMRPMFDADELAGLDRRPFRLTCDGVDQLRSRLRALTVDPQLAGQHVPRALDPDAARVNGSPGRGSCITIEPTR
jgi:hypothetical protein